MNGVIDTAKIEGKADRAKTKNTPETVMNRVHVEVKDDAPLTRTIDLENKVLGHQALRHQPSPSRLDSVFNAVGKIPSKVEALNANIQRGIEIAQIAAHNPKSAMAYAAFRLLVKIFGPP